jgi:glucose-6-phosphate isomerase
MPYRQIIDSCLAETIGTGGLDAETWRGLGEALGPAVRTIARRLEAGELAPLSVARRTGEVETLVDRASTIADGARDVLVLGIGGSSLGGQTLLALRGADHGARPRLHFLDNVDPGTWQATLEGLDAATLHVLAISKSGGTAETLAQALLAEGHLRDILGAGEVGSRVTVITEPGDRPLRRLGNRISATILEHDPDVGGRFSALTLVGLLPAAIAGLDIGQVRAGAVHVLDRFLELGAASEPAQGAALAVGLDRCAGKSIQAVVPYSDRLAPFAQWHAQIWAESLGKQGQGTTPVPARGVTDQHSQLQLWLDGPRDKWVTVLGLAFAGQGPRIDTAGDADLAYLEGRSLGDLMAAEREATIESLAAAGVPTRRFDLDRLDEAALGALMAHFMLETVIAAELMEIDPFGQPAVEDGKRRARARLETMAS